MVTARGTHKKKAPEALKATATRSGKRAKKASQTHINKSSEQQVKTDVGLIHCHGSREDVTVNSLATPSVIFLKSLDDDYPASNMKEEKGQISDGEVGLHERRVQNTAADSGGASASRSRLDTSSLEQKVEGLEALLELCARLFQDGKYQELEVVLKPFGSENGCPRETAIWLTKIFKEKTSAK
ncbi:serine/threonine-protein kinase Nek1-like [Argentina anserina]|uniref:serine/threonine-protein kinase Nek1-like n=1 Tax=Argentina anserina TaxID=57926 RepID=UPI0021765320|nr:serine/threonine-protein kinase Nek1-like [Potentilla anserina]